ncbi:hypothetical protein BGX29_009752 [Mortierella sp. GBA35]|nr:hypothetical protein BGX29_009752 [Mortierella sp. GBA35]
MISFINPLYREREPSSPLKSPRHSLSRQQNQQFLNNQQDQFHSDKPSSDNKPRYYSIFSELSDQRERALQQFPCEERHSYNPHYQHNLVSSPAYSSPSSLCPSSAGSSPSSAYSSSSNTSLSRATGARALSQEQSTKNDHNYYRHYNRRQNQRHYAYQQQNEHYHDDWMFGISEDDSYSGASMTCAQPQDPLVVVVSSLSAAPSMNGSLRSSISRNNTRPQVFNGSRSLSIATSQNPAKNRRPTVTFSPVVLHHPAAGQETSSSFSSSSSSLPAPPKLLPSIAESTTSSLGLNSSMSMATAKAESTVVQQEQQQQQPASAGRMTAKQSLMRIAQLSKDQDGWCSHKAGQYTQGYAEARPRGMKLDGRRTRRL